MRTLANLPPKTPYIRVTSNTEDFEGSTYSCTKCFIFDSAWWIVSNSSMKISSSDGDLFAKTSHKTLLQTWINFNPGRDRLLHPLYSVWWNHLSIPKLHRLHPWSSWMDKLIHPTFCNGCNYFSTPGLSWTILIKGAPSITLIRKRNIHDVPT